MDIKTRQSHGWRFHQLPNLGNLQKSGRETFFFFFFLKTWTQTILLRRLRRTIQLSSSTVFPPPDLLILHDVEGCPLAQLPAKRPSFSKQQKGGGKGQIGYTVIITQVITQRCNPGGLANIFSRVHVFSLSFLFHDQEQLPSVLRIRWGKKEERDREREREFPQDPIIIPR